LVSGHTETHQESGSSVCTAVQSWFMVSTALHCSPIVFISISVSQPLHRSYCHTKSPDPLPLPSTAQTPGLTPLQPTDHILKLYAHLTNRLLSWLRPNRAADPSMLTAYARAIPFFAHHWTGVRSETWELAKLGVRPEAQGEGYGRELVAWGMEKAKADGVSASVVCSYGSDGFYRKCGFDKRVGNVCDGEGNPLGGVKGGEILFWDP
jgi:GNAT superfamily N-acetyltransferase